MVRGTGAGVQVPAVLAAVAAHGLPCAPPPAHAVDMGPGQWKRFLESVVEERLTGLLVRALEDGALVATDQQRAQAAGAHRRMVFTTLFLESKMLGIVDLLAGCGIDSRVLKGSAAARLAYPDASLRPFIDIDLLVPSGRFDDAVRALEAAGGHRNFPEPHPGFDQRFSKGATVVMPEGFELDLHRTLASGPFAHVIPPDDLFATCTPFEVGGRRMLTLGAEERFLHACLHAVLGTAPALLMPLRDVAQLALETPLDQRRIMELAERWHAQAVMARAVTVTWETLGLRQPHPLARWAATYLPTRAEHHRLSAYAEGATYASQVLAGLRDVKGTRAKAAYLRALAVPDSRYLEGRYISQVVRWRQGLGAGWRWLRSLR